MCVCGALDIFNGFIITECNERKRKERAANLLTFYRLQTNMRCVISSSSDIFKLHVDNSACGKCYDYKDRLTLKHIRIITHEKEQKRENYSKDAPEISCTTDFSNNTSFTWKISSRCRFVRISFKPTRATLLTISGNEHIRTSSAFKHLIIWAFFVVGEKRNVCLWGKNEDGGESRNEFSNEGGKLWAKDEKKLPKYGRQELKLKTCSTIT